MKIEFTADRAKASEWRRVARMRIKSLEDSPEWFSGNLERERVRKRREWKVQIKSSYWVIFESEGRDVGLMVVSKADEARGTDCWIGGCWVVPELRGKGIMRSMMGELDRICREEGWLTQGLGVWPENLVAIRAYERSGFVKVGDLQQSVSKPDKFYQKMIRSI